MKISQYFSASYAEARHAFDRNARCGGGLNVEALLSPDRRIRHRDRRRFGDRLSASVDAGQ